MDEAALDHALLRKGIKFVVADPWRYLLLSLSRVPHYFKFWPSPYSSTISNVSRVCSFGLLLPLMLLGLILSWRSHGASIILLYLFIVIYSGIHLLSWASIRYRLPVDAVFLLFAGLAGVYLWGRRNVSGLEGIRGLAI